MRIFASLVVLVVAVALPTAPASAQSLRSFFNTGCIVAKSPAHGCAVTSVKGPGSPGPAASGDREGRACGYNILALFSWGDVRTTTAMRNAGITEISSVDSYTFELIPGFYGFSRYCTVVSGR